MRFRFIDECVELTTRCLGVASLERALRRDGPLTILQQTRGSGQVLRGRLRASHWARHAAWKPHILPYEYHALTADNVFTRALSFVASLLARATSSLQVRAALIETARMLRPGFSDVMAAPPIPRSMDVPQQWAIYRPAWEIAVTVLGSRSLLGAKGPRDGLNLVIEAWPLLEHLLDRVLARVSVLGALADRDIVSLSQRAFPLLREPQGSAPGNRDAKPDGILLEHGTALAVCDAKYSRRREGEEWPPREHLFQVLTAAAAAGAATAVLVYPDRFAPAEWRVLMGDRPARVICLGMDMFRVASTDDEEQLATSLASILGLTAASPVSEVMPISEV